MGVETNAWEQPKLKGEGRVRVGHTMTAGDQEKEIWVLGGTMGAASVMDVQLLDLAALTWSSPILSGSPPEARSRHSANRFGDSIFVFGGGDHTRLFNDVWRLNLKDRAWSLLPTTNTPPSARWGHTATLVDTRLFIFGGHDGKNRLNDVHILDLHTFAWFSPDCKAKAAPSPRPKDSLTSSFDDTLREDSDSNLALDASSSSSSSTPASTGTPSNPSSELESPPSSGRNATTNSTKTSTISTTASSSTASSSTSATSPQASSAKRAHVGPTSPEGLPPARAGHSANCMGRKLIIYGGGDGKLLGDMYYLHVDTFEWSVMESGNVPDRCAHTSEVVHTPGGWRLLVFGGSNGIKTFNDLYLVTCSKNRVRAPSGKRKSSSLIRSNNDAATPMTTPTTQSTGKEDSTTPPSSANANQNTRSTQNASPRAQSSPRSPNSPRLALPTLSYKDALQKDTLQKAVPPKTQLKKANSGGVTPSSKSESLPNSSSVNNDRLYNALKAAGMEKYYSKFVEQEIAYNQLLSLSESHLQALGITTIRDKALMAKLKENVQAEQNQFISHPAPSKPCYAAVAASATSAPQQPSLGHYQPAPNNTSDLVRKVQLSADALANAADSLRAAAHKAVRTDD